MLTEVCSINRDKPASAQLKKANSTSGFNSQFNIVISTEWVTWFLAGVCSIIKCAYWNNQFHALECQFRTLITKGSGVSRPKTIWLDVTTDQSVVSFSMSDIFFIIPFHFSCFHLEEKGNNNCFCCCLRFCFPGKQRIQVHVMGKFQ